MYNVCIVSSSILYKFMQTVQTVMCDIQDSDTIFPNLNMSINVIVLIELVPLPSNVQVHILYKQFIPFDSRQSFKQCDDMNHFVLYPADECNSLLYCKYFKQFCQFSVNNFHHPIKVSK